MRFRPGMMPWLCCAALASGCGGMFASNEPVDHVYWLEAVELRLDNGPTEPRPDLVVTVGAVPGLDTDRLLVKGPGARLNHYAGARWPDHLPEVLTAMLRVSLENSGRFHRVSSETHPTSEAWFLKLELREFFAVTGALNEPPEIRVRLSGHLTCALDETGLRAAAAARARENNLTGIVAAFQKATNEAMIDLGRLVQTNCFPADGG